MLNEMNDKYEGAISNIKIIYSKAVESVKSQQINVMHYKNRKIVINSCMKVQPRN